LLYIDCRQARRSSLSLAIVLEAPTGGEGFGTMNVGSMGGRIDTALRGIFASDLNNYRGTDGATGWVATSSTSRGGGSSVLIFPKLPTGAFLSVLIPSILLGSTMECAGPRSSVA
jgi:hypothetical protein